MKKYLLLILVACIGIISSCKYDDGELWGSVDDLANRVSALETLTQQMNGDVSAIQTIITAVENQDAISEVEKLTDGYILHFTNGKTATIKNGIDGADGENGKDGVDAPAIGVSQVDGVYYWTLTADGMTEWLTDETGSKLPVSAPAAEGGDGTDGADGASGKDGRTPTLKIDEKGFWMVSYDGTNFDYIKDQNEERISALSQNGTNGVAKFSEVIVDEKEEKLTIVMNDDNKTTYILPIAKKIEFFYDQNYTETVDIKNIEWDGNNEIVLFYRLQLDNAKYDFVAEDNISANIDEENKTVTLFVQSKIMAELRAVLLFFNETQTLTSVFKFKVAPWDGESYSTELKDVEGEVNTKGIATPADLKGLAMMVNNKTQVTGRAASDENSVITYKLQNDIDLSGYNWEPIGLNDETAFNGVFDGNGYSIKGLTVKVDEQSEATGAGLFGVVENATLKGVTLKDASVDVDNDAVQGAGLLVGYAKGSVVLEEVIVEKEEESATNEVKGSQNTGSVAGLVSGSEVVIKNCEVKDANVKTADQGTDATNKASAGGVVGTLKVESSTDGTKSRVEIEGCKVDGIDLSATTDGSGTTSTSMGGVVGSLNVDENVEVEVSVSGNSVANTQVSGKNDSEEGGEVTENETSTQGTVVGNLSELDSNVAGNIIKDNEVSEDTQIENQLTVSNLQAILDMVVTSSNINTFDVKGGIEAATEIEVPSVGADVTLNFASLVTSEGAGLTIKQGEGTSGNATNKLTINMSKENQYLNIQAPQSTVTLASGNYVQVHALTAKNTLVVEEGVTIETLEVAGGNVQVFGHVVNLVRAEGVTESIAVTIEEGGQVDYTQSEGFDVVDKNIKGDFVEQKDGTYVIYTAKGWKDFAAMINDGNTFEGKTIKLGADIDLKNELQTPIGLKEQVDQYSDLIFAGTLDGQNHCIKNLKIDNSVGRFTGLFAYIQKAKFKNLRIASGEVKGNGSSYVGAFLGYGRGVTFINCHNEGCKVVQVGDGSYAGGLTGALNRTADQSKYSFIIACTNSAEVSGVYCPAGITGGAWGGYVNIVACVNTGKISYSGSQTGQLNIYAAGIASSIGGNGWLYGCFTDCEIVPDGYNHSGLVSDLGYTGENINYSYSTNTELPLLTFGWGGSPENKTVGYSSYNDAVDNLNKGIQLYNWNATVPCTYQFVKGDKPTLVYTEPSTNPGGGSNNFGNGGKF